MHEHQFGDNDEFFDRTSCHRGCAPRDECALQNPSRNPVQFIVAKTPLIDNAGSERFLDGISSAMSALCGLVQGNDGPRDSHSPARPHHLNTTSGTSRWAGASSSVVLLPHVTGIDEDDMTGVALEGGVRAS
jgi:hypothetical protein